MDSAATQPGGRSRLTFALVFSLLGHALAIGMVWRSEALHGLELPAQVARGPEVHLRTESVPRPPDPVLAETALAEPAVAENTVAALASDQGWILDDQVPEVDEPDPEPTVEPNPEPEPEPEPVVAPEPERVSEIETPADAETVLPTEPEPESASETEQYAALETVASDALDEIMAAYRAELQRALQRLQTYPRRAQRLNLQGVAHIRFHIDASAGITASELVASSGHAVLDDAARTMVLSLTELPHFPAELQAQRIHQLSFDVPIEYRLN
ncbi:MAG: energy transducer TonB [Natronospirillum sp.]